MLGDLNDLLFSREVRHKDDSVRPLFRFQSELANAIVASSDSYKGKSSESIRPYLNQTLKPGNSSYAKSMSTELQNAIIEVVKSKLHEDDALFKSFSQEFENSYNLLKNIPVARSIRSELEYEELLGWQYKANRTFIFNRKPSEAKWYITKPNKDLKFPEAKELVNTMVNNLFKNFSDIPPSESAWRDLINKPGYSPEISIHDLNNQFYYRFYVPSFKVAKEVWEGLLKFIVEEISQFAEASEHSTEKIINAACHALEILNSHKRGTDKNAGFLNVFKIDGHLTTIPQVYFESTEGVTQNSGINNQLHEVLFTLIFDENKGEVSISRITGSDLDFWKEHVYYPIHLSNQNHFSLNEIPFKNVEDHIRRTLSNIKSE